MVLHRKPIFAVKKFKIFVQFLLPSSINNLTKINIDDFFNSILEEHNLKKKAFYNMCGILKQMLEYAVDAEYIEKNPYRVKVNKKKFVSSAKRASSKEVFQADEKALLHNGVNLSIVKDMLGHADESTTLKHYIYNIEDSKETDNKVLEALGDKEFAKSDQNIISFSDKRKTGNLEKQKLPAL